MGGWNYRIVKHLNLNEDVPDYVFVDIRDVFYTGDVPDSMGSNASFPLGADLEDFLVDYRLYEKALEKPVLVFDWNLEKFVDEMPEV